MTSVTGGGGLKNAKLMQDFQPVSDRMVKFIKEVNYSDKRKNELPQHRDEARFFMRILINYPLCVSAIPDRAQADFLSHVQGNSALRRSQDGKPGPLATLSNSLANTDCRKRLDQHLASHI
ncbi:hypothetical protein C1893_21650 [Pseudomonas sp. MPR-ANC1]|uniref:hypothetical protein n=1 Tax=Pseudomonas sp. MPR-ANC1 TaxID=2075548 RepID=UPI000CD16344|nr:hypothetical protein [Pseudomonas sp. MPR-ANC1]POA46191.1 hypothetical protein C1893_21650 [Pseudomonas sp. MPR-ANC1]